jgi:hypothetical protein
MEVLEGEPRRHEWHKTYDHPPEMALDPDADYYANLVTEKATIRIHQRDGQRLGRAGHQDLLARYPRYL